MVNDIVCDELVPGLTILGKIITGAIVGINMIMIKKVVELVKLQ